MPQRIIKIEKVAQANPGFSEMYIASEKTKAGWTALTGKMSRDAAQRFQSGLIKEKLDKFGEPIESSEKIKIVRNDL